MQKQSSHTTFVICIENTDYPAALERRKLYQVIPDDMAATHGLLRVIDESGEDYLYPQTWFLAFHMPVDMQAAILRACE